ncbi:Rv3654c family TadE-like protein [Gordonia sp. NPDC003376]
MKSGPKRLADDEAGFATLAATGVIVAVVAVILLVMAFGAAALARHRAQSAADLAALAAAAEHVAAGPDPCAVAVRVARWQSPPARVVDCRTADSDVVVRAEVAVDLGPLGVRRAEAVARAGPA